MDLLSWDKNARAAWRKALKELPVLVPAPLPVKVRRVRLPVGEMGDCTLVTRGPRRFSIRINRELPPKWAVDVLLHEWAHAVTWFLEKTDDHGPHFGVAYAKCFQQIEGEH